MTWARARTGTFLLENFFEELSSFNNLNFHKYPRQVRKSLTTEYIRNLMFYKNLANNLLV